ncbi:MAG: VCBS repeat-containing protein [Planctomycetota bacterium]|nr:VCBS repeat-containing protein [Planctomycetota bacterium]
MPIAVTFCAGVGLLLASLGPTQSDDTSLAEYFGFGGLEIVKIDRSAGPMAVADLDGDGFLDLIVVNNHSSRIELHFQKPGATRDDAFVTVSRANELPEHWRFRRQLISVSHRVSAVVPHDFDGDGLMDLIYAGSPPEVVFVRQSPAGKFAIARKHHVKDLASNRNGLAVADVIGDDRPELLCLVDGEIHVWTINGDSLGRPLKLATGGKIIAFLLEDYNGDGRLDIAGILPDDPAPIRLWLGGEDSGRGVLGAELRFEMPALLEAEALRLTGDDAATIVVIERASKRIVLYELAIEQIEQTGDRDAAMLVYSFSDAGNRKRSTAVVDVDGDGLLDLVATDTQANALVVYRQAQGKGLQPGESYPCYAELEYLVAGNVDDDPFAELFVLSEKEGVVGRCEVEATGVPYPVPLTVPGGHTPVALNLVELEDGPHVAIIAKDGRNYAITLIDLAGESETIQLGSLSRSPQTILALDADQDGRTDLLLFTRDKPMMMLHAEADGFELTESKDMGQFGLVKAAKADNTAVFDIDADGHAELLIADRNYVRAVRYDPDPPAGISPGWQVVQQINADDSASKLVSLAVLGDRIVAADQKNDRLVVMARLQDQRPGSSRTWGETESVTVKGFSFHSIHAGSFSGDGGDNLLAIGNDGFAVIRFLGDRTVLREFASWRTDQEHRRQHELATGDINGDGFRDLISLDAGEQMCEIFTFSESRQMLYAVGFEVFESKLFSGGEPREYEPSEALVADVTGDGADDLLLLAHDRVLIYPQMTQEASPAGQ